MYENEETNVEKSVQTHMLLESVKRLEARIRNKYYDYPYGEIETPKYCESYPYTQDEAKKLLQLIYSLLRKLENYLKSKGTYGYYYDIYFKPYYQLFNELCQYYEIKLEELEKDELSLLKEQEKREYELLRDLGQLTNHPELPEQYLKKVEWARKPFEEKLAKVINKWWEQRKKNERLSKQPTYAGKTVEEWIQELDLKGKGKELALKKPWMLTSPGGRHTLKQIDKQVIIYDD